MVGSVYTERQGPGTIAVVCQIMAPATLQAVKAIVQELEKFGTAAPSLEELNIAKESAINSFVFAFLTPGNIVSAWSQNEFYGYAPDYLEKFNERIAALNPNDILAVAKKYYSKEGMKIVVVGDSKKIGASLDALGKVTKIPLDQSLHPLLLSLRR
jgi:zinc protease